MIPATLASSDRQAILYTTASVCSNLKKATNRQSRAWSISPPVTMLCLGTAGAHRIYSNNLNSHVRIQDSNHHAPYLIYV
jgi:hypothetical protein